ALETEFSGLPRLQTAVPTDIGRRVRIAATQLGVPAVSHSVITGILPADIPTIYRSTGVIGHLNRRSEAVVPLICHRVFTRRMNRCCQSGSSKRQQHVLTSP